MKKAMYAFSGDPITYGHIDIIQRAAKVFDEIVVGIGINPDKKYLFSLEERTEMAEKSLKTISNATVTSFKGLLVDYAYENKIPVIIKGVRDEKDFSYETLLHQIGESQKLDIDTFLLPAEHSKAHISSSAAKAILKEHGLIHEYVPLYVKQCLEAKMSQQYFIGVTGEIGAGKSYLCKKFVDFGKDKGMEVHNIELDHIGHEILEKRNEPIYREVRVNIAKTFGDSVHNADGTINRKNLGEIVFSDTDKIKILNEIMQKPIEVRLRKEIFDKKGIILINAALIAESGMTYLCNNNIVLVSADKSYQQKRLQERNLTKEQIQRRLVSQC